MMKSYHRAIVTLLWAVAIGGSPCGCDKQATSPKARTPNASVLPATQPVSTRPSASGRPTSTQVLPATRMNTDALIDATEISKALPVGTPLEDVLRYFAKLNLE